MSSMQATGAVRRSTALVVLGGLFAVPALFFFLMSVIPNVYLHIASIHWKPVPARVLETGLERHRGDSTTYRVTARFTYNLNGIAYTSENVGWTSASDNIGDWHEQTYLQLDAARRAQEPVTLWVSPEDPAKSVYDRSLRWNLLVFKLVFVLLFGGAGVAATIYGAAKKPVALPGTPMWLANPAWRDNRIRSNAKAGALMWWAIGTFMLLLSSPLLLAFRDELAKGNDKIWLALVLPAGGLALLATAFAKTVEWKKHGVTPLTLEPFPGEIGERVAGFVDTHLRYRADPPARATLSCIHHYRRHSGGKTEMRETTVWQDTRALAIEPGPTGIRLRFDFHTEDGLPSSSEGVGSYHEWRLDIHVEDSGFDLNRTFVIPVFDRKEPTAGVQPSGDVIQSDRTSSKSTHSRPPESIVRIGIAADGLHLDYPLFRSAGSAFGLLLIGLLFGGCIPLWNWVSEGSIPLIFPIAFGFFGVLLTLAGLYVLGNTLHVLINGQGIVATRRLYGIPFTRRVAGDRIVALKKSIASQSRSGSRTRVDYRIELETTDRRRVCVGDSLSGASQADYIIEKIRAHLPAGETFPELNPPQPTRPPATAERQLKKRRRTIRLATNFAALALFIYFMWDFVSVFLNPPQ